MSAVGIGTNIGTNLGKKGLQDLLNKSVTQAVDIELTAKMEPRIAALEARISAIEARLDMSDRVAKLEAEVAALKSSK